MLLSLLMDNFLVKTFFTTKENGDLLYSEENRKKFLQKNKLNDKYAILMNQVHGSKILVVDNNYFTQSCDGLITQRKDVILFVFVADCFPILFFDPVKEVIAVAHAGREGSFQKISCKMIKKFQEIFYSKPQDILVEIGPGAGACCYSVCSKDNKYCNYVSDNFGEEFVLDKNIDLLGINKKQLLETGVLKENININNVCTICGDNYFSFRKGSLKERFAGIITMV